MVLFFLFEFILKAVLLTLGLLAWQGARWAAITFVVLLCVIALFDFVAIFVFLSANHDIERRVP